MLKVPIDILKQIYTFIEDDNISLSQANRLLRMIYLQNIVSLELSPQLLFCDGKSPNNILTHYISSRTNINKLKFINFTMKHQQYLSNLILSLQDNIILLPKIKKVKFDGIKHYLNKVDKSNHFNNSLLNFLSTLTLESIHLQLVHTISCTNVQHIINIPTLKYIKLRNDYNMCQKIKKYNFTFKNNKELTKVTFIYSGESKITIDALNVCPKLKSLNFINIGKAVVHIQSLFKVSSTIIPLLNNHYWPNITRLTLSHICCVKEEYIPLLNNFPNLEYLLIDLYDGIDYSIIFKKLVKLQTLIVCIISGQLIIPLVTLPNIKILQINNIQNFDHISEYIQMISVTCVNLQILSIERGIIYSHDLKLLVDSCPKLIVLDINLSYAITIEEIKYLLDNLKMIKYILIEKYHKEKCAPLNLQYPFVSFYIGRKLKIHKICNIEL